MPVEKLHDTELKSTINKMRVAADVFQSLAVRSGNHKFAILPGIIHEYIEICEQELGKGSNFKQDPPPSLSPSRLRYLRQKLEDLFGPELLGQYR
jgi:hypothetical protein